MASLLSIGVSSLNSFQTALATVSQNITNSETEGYSRQSVQMYSMGESGNIRNGGVYAGDPVRNYNDFLRNQVNGAESRNQEAEKYLSFASRLSNLVGATDTGVVKAMDNLFTSASDLRNNPSSATAKADYISKASFLTTQTRSMHSSLNDIRSQINDELDSYVGELNDSLKRLATINESIVTVSAQQGGSVNGLFDARDRIVKEVNEYIDVDAKVNSDGTLELFTQSGLTLLNANQPIEFGITAGVEAGGVSNYQVTIDSPTAPHNVPKEISSKMQGGLIGGMLAFRDEMLEPAERKLAHSILVTAELINTQQQFGYTYEAYDLDPTQRAVGQNMFESFGVNYQHSGITVDVSFASTALSTNEFTNTPATSGEMSTRQAKLGETTAGVYLISYDGAQYTIKNEVTGDVATSLSSSFEYEGLDFNVSGIGVGESIEVDPYSDYLAEFTTVSDFSVDKIAVSGSSSITDSANSQNIEYIEDLKDLKVLNGGSLTTRNQLLENAATVGAQTNTAELNVEAYALELAQLEESAAEVSGVNLDTELAVLLQYQQAYQAAGKIVETSTTIFDTLLRAL